MTGRGRVVVAGATVLAAACGTPAGIAVGGAGDLRAENGWRPAGAPGFEAAADTLTRQIVAAMDARRKRAIAVVAFSDDSGRESELGRFLAEELTTKLFQVGRFEVIERRMLDRVLDELKRGLTGPFDPRSAKEVGRLLSVDAIVTGTHTDLGEMVRINARLVGTEEGRVLSAAAATLGCDGTVARMRACGGGALAPSLDPTRAPAAASTFFQQDFSSVEEGRVPEGWVTDDGVGVKQEGRDRVLTALLGGSHKVVIAPLRFSDDFEVEMLAQFEQGMTVVVGGVTFRVQDKTYALSPPDTTVALTGASNVDVRGCLSGSKILLTLRKKGPVFRLLLDGRPIAISRVSEFIAPESLVFRAAAFRLYRVTVRGLT
jgi:TolB-like protein